MEFSKAFLDQGIMGAVILALIGAVVYLYKQVNAKQAEKDTIQEKRIAESRESIKAVEQNTNTLETLTEVFKASRNA